MGCSSSKQNVKETTSPSLLGAGEQRKVEKADDAIHRIVKMTIREGALNPILAFLTQPAILAALRAVEGLVEIEMIALSDQQLVSYSRYQNRMSMERAEPQVRELLKPVSEHYAGPPERVIATGGTVVLEGKRVWTLDHICHRITKMQIRPGTLEQMLADVSKPDVLALLRSIPGLLDIDMIAIGATSEVVYAHTRYLNKASMEQAESKIREILRPVTQYFAAPPERYLSVGGMVSLAGSVSWTLSKSKGTLVKENLVAAMKPYAATQEEGGAVEIVEDLGAVEGTEKGKKNDLFLGCC
jgi:hypothetical protein